MTIKLRGSNEDHITSAPKSFPLPNISRIPPKTVREMVKPSPIPRPSAREWMTGFLEAKASALPKMMQLTTIRGTKIPNALYMGYQYAWRSNSAMTTKEAMTTM